MTPDTSAYMIAGFIIIFLCIVGYAASLIFRKKNISKKIIDLEDNDIPQN